MLKLVRYIRPYAGVMVIIFLLLFAQAMIDLSLPEYMSRIVNVGIQQNGIEEPLPAVLRSTSLDRIKLLLPQEAEAVLQTAYRTLDRPSLSPDAYAEWQSRYPLLSSEALAVLDDKARLDEELRAELTRALAVLAMLTQDGFALPELPAGTDPFVVLASLPPEQRALLTNKLEERLQAVPDLMLNQSAIAWIGAEYEQVGLDQAAIQSRFILNTGGLMLVIALLGAACAVAVGYFASRTAAGISRDLRLATFSRVEQFASAEFDTFSTASLITRTTNDVQQIQMALVMLMRILFFAPILGTGGIIKVVNANIAMGWIIALAVAVLMTLIIVLFQVAVPRFKKIQKLVDRLNLVTR
ncbi:MAG: ABC transporter transmembrane domain-containing protein, partial [Eubacteriales bacterium]|nr:ABC transporter transmembrane domain-containing protein [Eubacteriales bacterium]